MSNASFCNSFASVATACNFVGARATVGPYVLTNQGIFLGDPVTNPFGSSLIIDIAGRYVGSVDMSQVVGLESLNFSKLADGITSFQSTGSVSSSAFENVTNNALFDINL
jgi:predicted amidohydrolase